MISEWKSNSLSSPRAADKGADWLCFNPMIPEEHHIISAGVWPDGHMGDAECLQVRGRKFLQGEDTRLKTTLKALTVPNIKVVFVLFCLVLFCVCVCVCVCVNQDMI